MRLVSYSARGAPSYGVVKGDGIIDLKARLPSAPASLKGLLGTPALGRAAELARDTAPDHALGDVRLLPVIPDPDKIVGVGLNYRDHVAESGRTVVEKPTLFLRVPSSQVGHLGKMRRPRVSTELDFEGELAVVIGKAGRYIDRSEALSHVAGYSCYNDGSIRDWQRHTSQFTPGKNFPATGGFGPWLVTADEIPDPSRLELSTRLNGVEVQHSGTDMMIFTVEEQIAYVSGFCELLPGDVIITGTPAGVGSRHTPPLWMKAGDRIEVAISKIGTLENVVADDD